MDIIIFYSHIVPYKWRIGVSWVTLMKSPKVTLLPVQRNVYIQRLLSSFLLKTLSRREGESWEKSGVFIRRSVSILLYDVKLSLKKKKKKIQSLTVTLLPLLFIPCVFQTCARGPASSAWLAALTLNYA